MTAYAVASRAHARRQASTPSLAFRVCLWLFIGFAVVTGGRDWAAWAEMTISPVLGEQVVYQPEWRDTAEGRQFHWRWQADKLRAAKTMDIDNFLVRTSDGRRAILPAYRCDEKRPFETERSAPAGTTFDVSVCSIMPPWADEKTTFDIIGYATYPGFLDLWQLRVPIPVLHHEGKAA